jgi:hypothetical protein
MLTASRQAELKSSIEVLVRKYVGDSANFSMDLYLKNRGIADISLLSDAQKGEFAEGLVDRFIRPRASAGKASLARVELLSVLGLLSAGKGDAAQVGASPLAGTGGGQIGPAGNKGDSAEGQAERDNVPDHPLSPRKHIYATEMKDEFQRMHRELSAGGTEKDAVKTLVSEIFGQMSLNALIYSKDVGKGIRLDSLVRRNLMTYMGEADATEAAKSVMSPDGGANGWGGFGEEEALSKRLGEYFTDMNHVLWRRLKNENNIHARDFSSDSSGKKALKALITYYFGLMSHRYVDVASKDLDTEKPEEEIKLINSVIYDCMQSLMLKNDVEGAYGKYKEMFIT